jgi:predicted nucleic acid-binding protein
MSRYVVDASIVVKLYVNEVHSSEANRFFSDGHDLIAPDMMLAEFGNIIWKKVMLIGDLTQNEGRRIITAAQALPFDYYAANDLLADAFEIALATQRTVYDCLYVALAVSESCQFITDDRKLFNAMQPTSYSTSLTLIENY